MRNRFAATLLGLLVALATGLIVQPQAVAQIYVTNGGSGTIGEYSTSGATINAALVSGLHDPTGLALFNGDLYVANNTTGIIGVYDATTGAPVNPSFITGVPAANGYGVNGITVNNGQLFVTSVDRVAIYVTAVPTTSLPGRLS